MKTATFLTLSVLTSLLAAGQTSVAADLLSAAPSTAPASADANVQAIQQAPDPSTAIQAYARAQAAAPNNIAAEQAYVHRMVSFGLPEMAENQAAELSQSMPTDGIAWAVLGYMNAKRNQLTLGLSDISMAARYAPQDPFVQRTAGQLIAWYDARADKSQTGPETQTTVESLRKSLASQALYRDTYAQAAADYKLPPTDTAQAAASAPTQSAPATTPGAAGQTTGLAQAVPATPPPATPLAPGSVAPESAQAAPGPIVYTPYPQTEYVATPVYVPYSDPYLYAGPAYSYWYPGAYWGSAWWWPSFGFVFSFDNHDDHHGHGGHDGHGGNDGHDGHWGNDGHGTFSPHGGTNGQSIVGSAGTGRALTASGLQTRGTQTAGLQRVAQPGVRTPQPFSTGLQRGANRPANIYALGLIQPDVDFPAARCQQYRSGRRAQRSGIPQMGRSAAPQFNGQQWSGLGLSRQGIGSSSAGFRAGGFTGSAGQGFGGGGIHVGGGMGGGGMHAGGGGGGHR